MEEILSVKKGNGSVSIIIPVYNVEKYIEECLDSVINQTYKDLEIILVNDGSTDSSPKICEEYAKKDERIKVVHKQNGGLSDARNVGIENAVGEFLVFIDSDDYIALDAIEQLMAVEEKTGADVVITKSSESKPFTQGVKEEYKKYDRKGAITAILKEKGFTTTASAKLYRKTLFENVRFPKGLIYEDFGTVYKLLNQTDEIVAVDSVKYFYRYNQTGLTKSSFSSKQMDYFTVWEQVYSFIKENYPELKKHAKNHSTRIAISFMRKISESEFEDKEIIDFLVKRVRKNILRYCFSRYALKSKAYGLLISIAPQTALKVFRG